MSLIEMAKLVPMLPMNDGFDIPQIGLVSFRTTTSEDTKERVMEKLDGGIRHLGFH